METKKSKAAAKAFAEYWENKGKEKQETARFWLDLLQNVLGVANPTRHIEFEKPVQLTHTNFIDAYIPASKVLVEQKKADIDLHRRYPQSDGTLLTAFEQAKRYADELPYSLRPRWIVACNFHEFLIYDLERPRSEPEQILLKDLEKEYYRLQFLVDEKNEVIRREEEISLQAGELVGKLYDALYKEYINPNENSLRSLNILCVRIVFCLYAEDAGLFDTKTSFEDYIKSFNISGLRKAIIDLFKGLDTRIAERDKYDTALQPFPYVNGGLFAEEGIEIPNFTQEIVDVIVNHCAPFNWSEISPTIFGSVFESTLNPDTRRKGGMHYTSIENIHKVIDPLFLDDLRKEFSDIVEACHGTSLQKRNRRLLEFQNKLASLTFLDPACGSGNFLTETYMSLRRLENEIISVLNKGESVFGFGNEFVKVNINQFYGIEINDFAVDVAKTALWIAECQMMEETEKLVGQDIDFLPLKNHANIVEGNALRMDWGTLEKVPAKKALYTEKLNVYKVEDSEGELLWAEDNRIPFNGTYKELDVITKKLEIKDLPKTEKKQVVYDYIMGNPPFSGAQIMDKDGHQKEDMANLFPGVKGAGNLDYVCCWYKKAGEFIHNKRTRCAFVSTNSIVQGIQVATIWKPLLATLIQFDFAYQSFKWESESTNMARVHCVIIGFSDKTNDSGTKMIVETNGDRIFVQHINPYLLDMPDFFIESRAEPLCKNISPMIKGSQPTDGGNLIIKANEYEDFIKQEPRSKIYIREFIGSEEFLYNKKRYCLWLVDTDPAEIRRMPLVMKRVEAVKTMRSASKKQSTRDWSAYPYLFTENRQPQNDFIVIPEVSSEKRQYVPMGFLTPNIICSNKLQMIPNATLYMFGILTSSTHMAWMRTVCGRLETRYDYSASIVYNNFPWCNPTEEQKAKIENTAQTILDIRASFPDANLADLYDERVMPKPLRNAHRENDKAVMQAYGFDPNLPEEEIVAELFKMYETMTRE